jgi:predicted nucleic acid-binding protein
VLLPRIWALRPSLTACDAAYVALAEAVGASSLTCDGKWARSRGHDARIELFEP